MASKETNKRFHHQLIAQMLTLATTSFGLVAALAWNETIQAIVKEFIQPRVPGSGIISQLIYALIVTILAVFITFQLSRIASKK